MPHFIAGKEISLEDVRLALEKMPDRFFEHPATVLVFTNMFYTEAPWLRVKSPAAANSLVWKEVALRGNTSHEFGEQITGLEPFLADSWRALASPKTGNPIYERPTVLIVYREDHKFLLDSVIPKPGQVNGNYDLVIASSPTACACRGIQGEEDPGAPGTGACARRTPHRHTLAWQGSGRRHHPEDLAE